MRSGIFIRGAMFGAVLAGLSIVNAPATRAAELTFPVDETVSRFVLPLTPFIFDAIVQGSRSVAEITYDRRGYDAVTNTLFVKGLHIKRAGVDIKIAGLRADLGSVIAQGFEFDTRSLELPPPVAEALRRAGHETIKGDILIGVKTKGATSGYEVTSHYSLDGIGELAVKATVDDLHVLVPFTDLAYGYVSETDGLTGGLLGATIAYQDKGLMKLVLSIAGEAQGSDPAQLKNFIIGLPSQIAMELIRNISGGASPALQERVNGWANVVEQFLRDEDAIRITLSPAQPVPLQRLAAADTLDEALILELNPSVARGFAEPLPAPAEPGSVAEGTALVSGEGALQDREDGARKLLGRAANGEVEAVRALAAGFGASTNPPALEPDGLSSLYTFLLIAGGLDGNVSDRALDAIMKKLPSDKAIFAEESALGLFGRYGGKEPVKGSPADYGADDLRALAYLYYEGRTVPRSYARAFILAAMASAAGDDFAADLRDDLTAAAQRGDIALDLVKARREAASMWRAYSEAHVAKP